MVDICHFMEITKFFKTRVSFEYFLGLAISDGNMSKNTRNRGKLQIELKASDGAILDRLQASLKVFASLSYRYRSSNFSERFESKTLRICNKEFRDFILSSGMPYGSKLNVGMPKGMQNSSHFWRGMIDGDGSLGLSSSGLCFVSFTTKSQHIAAAFCKMCKDVAGIDKTMNRNARDDIYNLMVTKESAQKIVRFLKYDKTDLAVARKKERALSVIQWKRPNSMRKVTWEKRRWTADEDSVVMSVSTERASYLLNRTTRSVSIRKWRLQTKERSITV